MDDRYMIPANAKRGKLIFSYFRGIDLAIFAVGIFLTMVMVLIFQDNMNNNWIVALTLIPFGICGLLVLPVPNQHNILVLLQEIYRFYFVNRQKYVWKGWCESYGNKK